MLELVFLVFEKNGGSPFCMNCLNDLGISVFKLTDIGFSMLDVLAHFVKHIAKMLVLDGELVFEFVDHLLTRFDKYTTRLVNVVDLMDRRSCTVFSDQRSRLEIQIPAYRIEVEETA